MGRPKWHARGGPNSRLCGGQGTRGAHGEHVVHLRDLGRVEGLVLPLESYAVGLERVEEAVGRQEVHGAVGVHLAGEEEIGPPVLYLTTTTLLSGGATSPLAVWRRFCPRIGQGELGMSCAWAAPSAETRRRRRIIPA